MLIIPAIDIMDGKVVRLERGDADKKTVYSNDPVGIARKWQDAGAKWLHLVDLDGALSGIYKNLDIIERIVKAVDADIELGGGIRTKKSLRQGIELGASRVVLGTKATEDEEFVKEALSEFGDKIAIAIDSKGGFVSARGWVHSTKLTPVKLANKMQSIGIRTLIFTDISRDGMLSGPNLKAIKELLNAVDNVDIIASGGISCLNDILKLKRLEPSGLCGVIVGKALYEGKLSLKEAID